MGSETVKTTARLRKLLAYLSGRIMTQTLRSDEHVWAYYDLEGRIVRELARRRQAPPPG